MLKNRRLLPLLCALLFPLSLIAAPDAATKHAQKLYQEGSWKKAESALSSKIAGLSPSLERSDLLFMRAVCLYNLQEYDHANDCFSEIMRSSSPTRTKEIIEYKYHIAEKLRNGAKKRLMGVSYLPKWSSGQELALEIYDEICMIAPSHELAAYSFFAKSQLYLLLGDFTHSIEELQQLITKFPEHHLLPAAYLFQLKVYEQQAIKEPQNPDIVALSELVLERYETEYPNAHNKTQLYQSLAKIKEYYAQGILESAAFFERLNKPRAAALYYQSCSQQFPDTRSSHMAKHKLNHILQKHPEIDLKELNM